MPAAAPRTLARTRPAPLASVSPNAEPRQSAVHKRVLGLAPGSTTIASETCSPSFVWRNHAQEPARAIVCAGLAGIIALGTCGCSTSKETTVTTEVTDEDGKTHTTKTTEKDGEVESTTTESTTIDVSD